MAIFKLSYNYMKLISLQNVMEKIINDIITFISDLYFKAIVLLLFCTVFLFSTSTSVLNGLVNHT